MSCSVCLKEMVPGGLSAHTNAEHSCHKKCLLSWFENHPEEGVTCPFCKKSVEALDNLVEDPIIGDQVADLLLLSKNIEQVKWALDNCFFFVDEKYQAMYVMAESGNLETFELLLGTLDSDEIDLYEVVYRALISEQFEFAESLFERGLVVANDLRRTLTKVAEKGCAKGLEFLLAEGVRLGPVTKDDEDDFDGYGMVTDSIMNGHPGILKLLLENGIMEYINEACLVGYNEVLKYAFDANDPAYLELLLEYGMNACVDGCSNLLNFAKSNNLERIKWYIETAKCPHRESWISVKEIALEEGHAEIYIYMCEQLSDAPIDIARVHLISAIVQDRADEVACLVANGSVIHELFPKCSNMVKSAQMYRILADNGCEVVPNVHIFSDALKNKDSDLFKALIEIGPKLSKESFLEFLQKEKKSPTVSDKDFRYILEAFQLCGVQVTEIKDNSWLLQWFTAIDRQFIESLSWLVDNVDMSFIITRDMDLLRECLFRDSVFNSVALRLIRRGLIPKPKDLVEAIKHGNCSFALDIIKRNSSLNVNQYWEHILQDGYGSQESHESFFGHAIDPKTMKPFDIERIAIKIRPGALMSYLARLDSFGAKFDHQKFAYLSSFESISWNYSSSWFDMDVFDQYLKKYSDRFTNWQIILERAVSNGRWQIARYLLRKHPDKVKLPVNLFTGNSSTCRGQCPVGLKTVSILGKIHCRECQKCSDSDVRILFNNPSEMKKLILDNHGIKYLEF